MKYTFYTDEFLQSIDNCVILIIQKGDFTQEVTLQLRRFNFIFPTLFTRPYIPKKTHKNRPVLESKKRSILLLKKIQIKLLILSFFDPKMIKNAILSPY